jgi:hypothetical protein
VKTSPTSRSLALLREDGCLVAIVEKFVRFPPPGHRVDLWGFGDLLACKPGFAPMIVQTTTADHQAERIAKIKASPHFETICASGFRVICHGWRKGGERGKRKTWICNVEEVVP